MARKVLVLLCFFMCFSFAIADDAGLLIGIREKDGRLSTVWVMRRGVATLIRKVPGSIRLWRDKEMWQFEESADSVIIRAPNNILNVIHSSDAIGHKLNYIFDDVVGVRSMNGAFENFDRLNVSDPLNLYDLLQRADVGGVGLSGNWNPDVPRYSMTRKEGSWWVAAVTIHDDPLAIVVPFIITQSSKRQLAQIELEWIEVIRHYPDALDFMAHDKTDIGAVASQNGIFIHRTTRTQLQNRVQKAAIEVEKVISVQWIFGKDLDKVARAMERKEPKAG